MKKRVRTLFTLMVWFTIASHTYANQDPKGLYRLQRFIYENGTSSVPNFSQYKYAADSVGLLISFRASRSTTQWSNLNIEIREPQPLKNTGEKPQGTDGHGNQIFNVNDRQFYFKWYNQNWPNMSKLNEFITEVYVKDDMEKEVVQAFNMLENKMDTKAGSFFGWWIRVGAAANPDGTGRRSQVQTIWKAYSPSLSMVVNVAGNNLVLGCNTTNTVRYENDTTIYEIGNRCDIHWINDHCHTLTFTQANGSRITEIWERGGLPRKWQDIFHSDIAVYRNAIACLSDAVSAVQQGELQKADEFISEAVNDKNVPVNILSQSITAIAYHLYIEKQQYKDCITFCERQLKRVKDYVNDGHDHDAASRFFTHQTEIYKAIATYRDGDQEKGKKMLEERLSIIDSEIEQFKAVKGMEGYINALYYCSLLTYDLGYDIFGTKRTLLYLDALTLMAPAITTNYKPQLLNCRANCYLLDGDKESARKLWQQIKDLDASYFKKQNANNPLRKAFGE